MGILIEVPFSQKDECKKAGGHWDISLKSWYIPDYAKICKFQRWLPEDCHLIMKRPFLIAQTYQTCWKCGEETPLISLSAKAYISYEYVDEDDDDNIEREWRVIPEFMMLLDTDYLPPSVTNYIQQYYPYYKRIFSKTLKRSYWANGCAKCGALQGDWFNYYEPHGAFCPVDEDEAARITLIEHDFPFDFPVRSGYCPGEDFIKSFGFRKCW